MAEVEGSYIRGIHQVAMIQVIYTLVDAIFSKGGVYVMEVVYMRYIQPAPALGNGCH